VSLIEKLRRAFRPQTINDPTFGRLLWFRGKPPHANYWEGQTQVEINADKLWIEVFLDGEKTGISEDQRAFFPELFQRIPELLEVIVERARTRPQAGGVTVGGLKTRWVALPCDPFKVACEVGFDIEGTPNIHVVATLLGWHVSKVEVED
jgi:hypothetical protein